MTDQPTYTIQQISQKTGLTVYTLRYYEEIGLLDPVPRARNGHRCFTDLDVQRIELLKKLRLTGMSIEGIRQIVDLYRGGRRTAHARRVLFEAHRENVVAQIEALHEVLGFIDYKIAMYAHEEEQLNERNDEHHYELSVAGENGAAGL